MQQAKPDRTLSALRKVGIERSYEVLLWAPKRHEDYTVIVDGNRYHGYVGQKVCIELTVIGRPTYQDKNRFTVAASDNAKQTHRLMIFGMLRFSPWANVQVGDQVWVRAKVVEFNGYHYLNSAEWIEPEMVGSVRPVYAGKQGQVSAAAVLKAVSEAVTSEQNIKDASLAIREAFGGMKESEILNRAGCQLPLAEMIRNLHCPTNMKMADLAMKCAKKIAVFHIRWAATEMTKRPMVMKSIIRINGNQMRQLVARLPYNLTDGEKSQISAIRDIMRLLDAPYPMDALLSADVGAGKTICYGLIAVAAQQMGHKVAILIPNSILVDQVVNELRCIFPEIPIFKICEGMNAIEDWSINPILIGTTKLFSVAGRAKWIPDLMVIDEQQKTAESQRNKLCGQHTNVLETTATPIPKSMALLTHGNKQLIQVRVQHADKRIITRIVDSSHKAEMFKRIKERVLKGDQVAIIYPRVTASSDEDTKSVVAAGAMWEKHFPGKVAVLHGKMKEEEKVAAMRRIKNGDTPVVIASSIIEIGITIENLRLIIVVHAERYGVFTLHQFRGRLARKGGEGECLLYLPQEVDEEVMDRIRLLEITNDGFDLAEMDMNARGFGDLSDHEGPQSGKTTTLFRGIHLMPCDLDSLPSNTAEPLTGCEVSIQFFS